MSMSIRPRGRGFEACVRERTPSGEIVRVRRTLKSYDDAQKWAHAAAGCITAGRPVPTPREAFIRESRTLQQAVDYVIENRWDKTCRNSRGLANQKVSCSEFVEFLGGDRQLSTITSNDLLALKAALSPGRSYKTVNRKLATLSVVLKEAFKLGWIDRVPHVPLTPEDPRTDRRMRYATKQEADEVVRRMREHGYTGLAEFVEVLAATGMRTGELLRLNSSKYVCGKIELEIMKNGNERTLPVMGRVRDILERRVSHRSGRLFPDVSQTQLNRVWTMVKGEMGLEDDHEFVPHALRHGVGTRLAQAGVHKSLISTWLGHRSEATTDIYIKIAGKDLEQVADVLSGNI
jgi:integrase